MRPQMRLILLTSLILIDLCGVAQDGLEGIIVEKFYVSSEADNKGSLHSGELPAGSVTYRIFVDLKPGFRFQAAYGSPQHPLVISSSQPFFNHNEAGTTHPNILPERALNENVALLDSWLSVGAAGENHLGIPKSFDDELPDQYIQFESDYFKNDTSIVGVSPVQRDGMQRSGYLPFPTFYQMDSCLYVLGSSTKGKVIKTENGAWACLGKGSCGADSLTTNTVLIAQLTTAGDLSFELNLLIGAPNGTSQRYVAKNPEVTEWVHKDLIFYDPGTPKKEKKSWFGRIFKQKKRSNQNKQP